MATKVREEAQFVMPSTIIPKTGAKRGRVVTTVPAKDWQARQPRKKSTQASTTA